ncbi:hypothetical protein PED39_05135 [Methanomassiliicoccales archaeon LGM-RCC1]|nr:hypothetical protein [Candidatus Methanomethylophilaceae archaeon]WII06971.1 hypothetical protein PED39_05135 [Methanomassiliicoccales archaeon LGM-RCC1]
MKSTYMAIIAVVIIAVAAVGVYFAFFNNGSENYPVDEIVREDLREGDYIEIGFEAAILANNNITGVEKETVLSNLTNYYGELTGQHSVTYKGVLIMCDLYEYKSGEFTTEYLVHPETRVVYGYNSVTPNLTMEYRLEDTNIDITKNASELTIEKSSYIKLSNSVRVAEGEIVVEFSGSTITTVTNESEGLYDCTAVSELYANADIRLEIEFVDLDTIKLKDIDEPIKKELFLAFISEDKLIAQLEEEEISLEPKSKTTEIEDVEGYGKRKVTYEVFDATKDEQTATLTLGYGEKGVNYNLSMVYSSDGNSLSFVVKLKTSNLISVPN